MSLHVTLVVFSQTGTTLAVAEAMSDALKAAGHEVLILPTPLFGPSEVELPEGGVLGVGSPSIYGRAPENVREYVGELTGLAGVPAFVFATSAGASGRVLSDLGQAVRARGARVMGGVVVIAEARGPVPWLHGRNPGRPDAADLEGAGRLALAVAERVARGSREPLPAFDAEGRPLGRLDAFRTGYGFYELVGPLLSSAAVRRLLPVPLVDEKACIRCRWCVRNCPARAIVLPEPEEWRRRAAGNGHLEDVPEIDPDLCIRCYRCLACPTTAYSVDWASADRIMRLVYHPRMVRLFGDRYHGRRPGGRPPVARRS